MAEPILLYQQWATELSNDEFLSRVRDPVLVLEERRELDSDSTILRSEVESGVLPVAPGPEAVVITVSRRPGSNSSAGTVTIGESTLNDICLWATGVEPIHALISFEGSKPAIYDFSSVSPTVVNGVPAQRGERRELVSGIRVVLGTATLTYFDPRGLLQHLLTLSQQPERPTPRALPAVSQLDPDADFL